MSDTFLKTLQSVLTGARQAEEFCHVVVTSATEDALLCVARDFGHDYGLLLKRYRDEVVARHASGSRVEGLQCRGTTRTGKPCPKRALHQGYCQLHARDMVKEQNKQRRVGAYAAAIPTASKYAPELRLLCGQHAAQHASRAAFVIAGDAS